MSYSELSPELNNQRLARLPQLNHLRQPPSSSDLDPNSYRPEIIDHHTSSGIDRLAGLISQCPLPEQNITIRPFLKGVDELISLDGFFKRAFEDVDFTGSDAIIQVRDQVAQRLIQASQGVIEKSQIDILLTENTLVPDLTTLIQRVSQYSVPEALEAESKWIWDPLDLTLTKFIGPDAKRTLSASRVLGLIPFDAINRIQTTRFRVLGASVAASTIDLLVALGAEDIVFVDGGLLDPSNEGKMLGDMADFRSNGESKAMILMHQMYKRNPYGSYLGYSGKVVTLDESKGPYDKTIDELVKDADEVIEVVDSAHMKIYTRFYMQGQYPSTPIGFIADVGSQPFAGREVPSEGNFFHQNLSNEEKQRMEMLLAETDKVRIATEGLRSVYQMVRRNFPPEHQLQFLLSSLGMIPFWSQTPISARESAATYAKIFIREVSGENITFDQAPRTLIKELSEEQIRTIQAICKKVFDIQS
ncbi:hypothetical protein HYS94_02340 [Candidatus Daviesbacteria bacterium]|nr:hypothetical protein [Candidatus Daviesbacteria bacterium]